MKYLLPLIAILLITSCASKKAELVEHIKVNKDSLRVYDEKMLEISKERNKKYQELFYTNEELDIKKYTDNATQKDWLSYGNKVYIDSFSLVLKKSKFKRAIDSLELELKKY